jgi:Fe-S-cluster containining protein
MDTQTKIKLLAELYALYDETVAAFETACGRGCSACCTCNVTCTTLEGWFMVEHLTAHGQLAAIEPMVSAAPRDRFRPVVTINQMVALCVRGDALPQESNDPGAGPCPWIENHVCPVYAVRPFACHAMLSSEPCHVGGDACMPPFILSLNNVMMQYLEALDRPGASGNMLDILLFLANEKNRDAYISQQCLEFSSPLAANRSFSVLMIPPEHRRSIQPFLNRLQAIFRKAI